jgi:hypothetical protein
MGKKNNVIRLSIYSEKSGLPIFDVIFEHQSEYYDDILYCGMMQGVNIIFIENLNLGKINEIRFEQGCVLIYRDPKYSLCFVLAVKCKKDKIYNKFMNFAHNFLEVLNEYHNLHPENQLIIDNIDFDKLMKIRINSKIL